MANTNAPRGFQPIKRVDGAAWTGNVTNYKIPSGFATSLYTGDVVKYLTTSYLGAAAAGEQFRGVVMGFKYIDVNGKPVQAPGWTASTITFNAQDVQVLVVDDPNVVFKARFTNSTSVPAVADQGAGFNLFAGTGVAGTGVSGQGIDYSTLATSATQFRFLSFATSPDNDTTSAYSLGLFVPVLHDFRVQTEI